MLENKDYCDYDTCVALKELGYNQYTSLRSYAGKGGVRLWDFDGEPNYKEGELIALSDMYDIPRDGNEVAAPSLYEAQKWLRERHNLHITIYSQSQESWQYRITKPHQKLEDGLHGEDFVSYEDALINAIKECIKHVG